jgi:hypothetical protein
MVHILRPETLIQWIYLPAFTPNAGLFDLHHIGAHQSRLICGERAGNHLSK